MSQSNIELPDLPHIIQIIDNGFIRKYVVNEKRKCPLCNEEKRIMIVEQIGNEDYKFIQCYGCEISDRYTIKTYERQTMPRCENCKNHFKMKKRKVPMKIYDKLGKRVCPTCAPQFLTELKKATNT